MASEFITADMVEGSEFSFLVVKYNVHGVPHTVINEEHSIVGAPPDTEFAQTIITSIEKE